MYVIGTAGHVDHGKSTLVKALTGIDPDRWEEEKRREMTIDLGFAWLTLPSGRDISVIDVPGHERFIKNMLAGIGGIDAALLIVAADESVMPQTEEHLAILDLLGLEHGLVVITKADLVDDEWLLLVQEELAERLQETTFANAPRIPVSARTGQGIAALLSSIDDILNTTASRATASGIPRLPVDRSFSIGGFGTVVTGTLLDGPLHVGQEVVLLPHNLRARVRGLQMHQERADTAYPGRRVAVNVAGVHHSDIGRGAVLTLPDVLHPTMLLDVQLRLLPNQPRPLEHNMALDLFLGAAEVRCHVALLDQDVVTPGETAWVQLRLAQPVVAVRGDRCIVRQPSPSLTIGGGVVINPHPQRHRRFRAEVVATLETLARGTPDDLLLQALAEGQPMLWEAAVQASGLTEAVAQAALETLLKHERVVQLPEALLMSSIGWQRLDTTLTTTLQTYHERFPLRRGMPREEVRQRLRLSGRGLGPVLAEAMERGGVQQSETTVWLATHTPAPTPRQQREIDGLLRAMRQSPFSPPRPELDSELLVWMLDQELLVRISAEVYFLPDIYDEMLTWVRTTIADQGSVSVAAFRNHFGTSRKYALALLENLDERRITRRRGDVRVLY